MQNPHGNSATQSPHVVFEAHASVEHSEGSQFQSAQLPALGPEPVPVWHVLVVPQKPHPGCAVHPPHVVSVAHGSEAEHSDGSQFQSLHAPLDGPLLEPCSQLEESPHHPQPMSPVQSSHDAEVHAEPPSHSLKNQRQSSHDPTVGPAPEPLTHVFVDPHQPQLDVLMHPSHVVISVQGSVPPVEHVPSMHDNPEQQSPSATHVWPLVRHAHRPASLQNIIPQQSKSEVHVPAASTQHITSPGLARHARPSQHSDALAHELCAGSHAGPSGRHVPDMHARPVRQRVPVAQHICPSPPHSSSHIPSMQRAHALPHEPQWRGSVPVSVHEPPQQSRPPLHIPPAQHIWPRPPQTDAGVWHVPPRHSRPSAHMPPAQHICRAPPQATADSHVPPRHSSPEAHVVPSQQGCRTAPHPEVAAHMPRSQTSPAVQVVPPQQGWRSAPHIVDGVQRFI